MELNKIERLSDLLKRAGGYKQNAYPYGGVLARKSVAENERLAFLRSADQLEQSIATAISEWKNFFCGRRSYLSFNFNL